MDFIGTLSVNYEKLRNKEIVNILWKEILKEERLEENLDQLIEYSFHYPVDSDTYLTELNEKFDEVNKEDLRTIDGHLRAYMITFLYYCTNKYSRRVPMKTTLFASNLYIKLISVRDIGKFFFEKNMFKLQLLVCLSIVKESEISDQNKVYTMRLLKKYVLKEKLELFLLKAVANTFTGVMMISTKEIVRDIKDIQPLPFYCIHAIKELVLHEEEESRLKCVLESLFRCLGRNILESVDNKEAARSVIKVFIKDVLQQELDEDKFQYLLDAFCITWGKEDYTCYEDAVIIMNLLKMQYYKELVRKMVLYTQSKNHRKYLVNIMNLLLAMARNLPTFPLDKVEVLYSCAIRNIVYHFLDKEKNIVDKSIETLTQLCAMKDNPMLNIMFNHVNCNGKFINMSIEALLLCINKIADEKWGISPRNQNLLVIVAKFVSSSSRVNSELVQKTMNTICKDFTPFSLRPSLPILHELYCALALKDEVDSAQVVLRIIFKSAMHQDATAIEFADHLFNSMINPSVIGNLTYDPKYYYNIFLTTEFEYEALFTKCQKHIDATQIENVIKNFDYGQPGAAVLLCCLLNYCKYEESTALVEYFINHFNRIATISTMGPLSIAVRKILINRSITQDDMQQLDLLHSHLLEGLFEQTYQVPSIKPAYDLLQKLRSILKIDMEDQVMNQLLVVTSERAFRRLHIREIGDHSVFMYLNELCLLMRKLPTENVIRLLEGYMDDRNRIRELHAYMPDVYLQLLTLFTTLAMMSKKKVPVAVKYLKKVLKDDSQINKVLGFKLYYALCQEITHEFADVIKFSFREIIYADPCLVRLCVIAIEELVHDDFIKLNAERFFTFIHVVGSDELGIFMKEALMKRFMLSNQNDIAKFYVQTIMYLHVYSKMSGYPISAGFEEQLVRMQLRLNSKKEIPVFLFSHLSIRKKFNVLTEISLILDDLVRGHCKIETNFYPMIKDLLQTFRFMINPSVESRTDKHYYSNVCKEIETKIVNADLNYKVQNYYGEYEADIRKCTLSLLKLVFFENHQILDVIQITLFDAVMHWIDFVKDEIINYIHIEKGKDYAQYFSKLLQYYKRNKGRFVTPDR